MFDLLSNLWMGATVALTPMNILLCLIGATVGTDRKSTRLNSSHT